MGELKIEQANNLMLNVFRQRQKIAASNPFNIVYLCFAYMMTTPTPHGGRFRRQVFSLAQAIIFKNYRFLI